MKLMALLLAAALCTGCSALPGEERSFAVALGIDESGGVWEACARVPTYQTGGGYMTLKGRGYSLGEALAVLNAAAPMELHYGQLRMLVFSAKVAETERFPAVLQALAARGEVRAQAALCVTQDHVADVLDALEPAAGSRLSKALESLVDARQRLGVLPDATLAQVQLAGMRQQCVLLSAALEPADGNAQAGMDAPAGAQTASGAGKVQLSGGWLMGQDGRVQGQLTPMEMQLLSLLQGKLRQGTLTLPQGTITLLDAAGRTSLQGNDVHARVKIVYSAASMTEDGVREALIGSLQSLAGKLAAANCDALGLGRQAMQTCADMTQWYALNWPQRFPALSWHFTVAVQREA